MSYGHAQNLAGNPAGEPATVDKSESSPVDPALWWHEDMRAVLWARDIGTVYRLILEATGMSQYRLAKLVGQSQSEVCEILKGRRVKDITLLERIVSRLGIPPELMRLSAYGPDGTYCGEDKVADPPEGVNEEMRRRVMLASAGVAIVGRPIEGLGELVELAGPSAVPLPSRIFEVHVMKVRTLIGNLREAARAYGSDPQVSSAAAEWATRLLGVPGAAPVKRALLVAVAELHSEAGWAAFDAGLYRRALYHYTRTLELAIEAEDAYLQALALRYAGLASVEHGHPDEGLKMLQCAQAKAWGIPLDDQREVVVGELGRAASEADALAESAIALACLGNFPAAASHLVKGRELWTPTRADSFGDMDRPAARLELARGRLDAAEELATASVRRWPERKQKSRILSGVVLATIHVKAGERNGLWLAHHTIT
ncbi:MAG: helix-turn-helix domain-containing protein, partial [Pseudonocardiaceae bacterium]